MARVYNAEGYKPLFKKGSFTADDLLRTKAQLLHLETQFDNELNFEGQSAYSLSPVDEIIDKILEDLLNTGYETAGFRFGVTAITDSDDMRALTESDLVELEKKLAELHIGHTEDLKICYPLECKRAIKIKLEKK